MKKQNPRIANQRNHKSGNYEYGWKVIRVEEGKMVSFLLYSPAIVFYELNKSTVPQEHNGPLAIFNRRKDAEEFIYENNRPFGLKYILLRVKYIRSKRKYLWSYRDGRKQLKTNLPAGTILAEEVIPVRKVKGYVSSAWV